jgi:uncharacterized protein DUF4383
MSTADLPGAGHRAMTWPQQLSMVVGAIYTVIGVVGYFITGFDNFFGMTGESLLGFMINPMHNLVHVVIGVAGIALARTLSGARTYGWVLAVAYGAAFIYGLFAVGRDWDFLNLNWADNILHLVTALIGLAIALGPVKTVATARGRDHSLGRNR